MESVQSRRRTFFRYVIPSIGSMLVTSLYVVVDGIFVGHGIGKEALGAINLAGPYIMVMVAISMMITVGGATMTAISLGRGEADRANSYFTASMKILVVFSLAMTLLTLLFSRPLARLLGASPTLVEDTATYLRFFLLFSIFFCSAMALAAFVRNDGDPRLAFWGMVLGGVNNIFLDWLFIFPLDLGITGAAIASGLGQTLSCIILSTHFLRKKGQLRLTREKAPRGTFREILKRGTPEFMNQLFQPVTVFCYNLLAVRVFGDVGVSAFSVVYYILTITVSVFVGLTQGLQPLISRSRGEGDREKERYYYRRGLLLNVILALGVYLLLALACEPVIRLFNSDPELVRIGCSCLRVYGVSFLLTAVNVVIISYLTAVKETGRALLLSALRCLVLIPLCIFLMPLLWGRGAVWTGIIPAEVLSLLLGLLLSRKRRA